MMVAMIKYRTRGMILGRKLGKEFSRKNDKKSGICMGLYING